MGYASFVHSLHNLLIWLGLAADPLPTYTPSKLDQTLQSICESHPNSSPTSRARSTTAAKTIHKGSPNYPKNHATTYMQPYANKHTCTHIVYNGYFEHSVYMFYIAHFVYLGCIARIVHNEYIVYSLCNVYTSVVSLLYVQLCIFCMHLFRFCVLLSCLFQMPFCILF